MKEDYLITVYGTMENDDDSDSIELLTRGNFVLKGDTFYITYKETEATGYTGSTTTVKVEGQSKVSMIRQGDSPSHLIIEKGCRHVCHYDTGAGALTLGVAADEISTKLTNNGGIVQFSYMLDVDSERVSKNSVKITVKSVN